MPIEITMPALSPTMTEGNLATWKKKEGDKIKAGDVIAEIETDKATMEVEAVDEGMLGRIIVKAGTEGVKVNEVIALLLEEGEDKKALDSWKPKAAPAPKAEEKKESAAAPAAAAPAAAPSVAPVASKAPAAPLASAPGVTTAPGARVKASPLAKKLAASKGIDLSSVAGTGPGGRIVRADVENYTGGGTGAVRRNPVEFVQVPNNSMRKIIARRLLESKQQVPHFYLTVEVEMDALLEARSALNGQAEAKAGKGGTPAYKLSVNDMIIKATALGLRDKPSCNVSWYDDAIIQYNNVDVSVAVATEGGLITPIVRNADQKSLPQISKEMKDLAARARENKLKPEEFQGGGFSISNLGMYGVSSFQAIINPPQACILAVGATAPKLAMKHGQVQTINVMNLTLSVDHRAVDGALGAELLQLLKRYIEQPILMFA